MDNKLAELLLFDDWPQKRFDLINDVSKGLRKAGHHLSFSGHCFGPDRKLGVSAGNHGSDDAVGIAILLHSSASIVSTIRASAMDDECYACAALLRQLLEFEYLTYCFANRKKDAAEWLRASDDDRRKSWQPRHMRDAANGYFESKHYDWHCRIGGHPTPEANAVLNGGANIQQLLICDTLMHSRRIWSYCIQWSKLEAPMSEIWQVSFQNENDLSLRLDNWFDNDPARHWESW